MPYAAAISEHPIATHALGEVVGQVLDQLGGGIDAALLFVTGPFAGALEDIAAALRATLAPGALIGATAAAVLANGQEVEGSAAISAFAVRLPAGSAPARTVRLAVRQQPDELEVASDLELTGAEGTLVLLADPFSFPTAAFLDHLAVRAPQLTVVGGLASAASGPGGNRLVAGSDLLAHGAVGLLLPPQLATTAIVSQAADPVGEALVVTRSTGGLIEEIAGQPALDHLLGLADALPPDQRARMARGLQLGIAVDERTVERDRGDFVIVPVLGGDKERRAVAVGADVAVGTTVQFHVRDAEAADADLRDLLVDAPGRAALVFSCTDRGRALFGTPDHDASIVHDHVEAGAVAGMLGAGEVGPVGGRSRLHTMSASVLLFDEP